MSNLGLGHTLIHIVQLELEHDKQSPQCGDVGTFIIVVIMAAVLIIIIVGVTSGDYTLVTLVAPNAGP
jgi:hypothetical protein